MANYKHTQGQFDSFNDPNKSLIKKNNPNLTDPPKTEEIRNVSAMVTKKEEKKKSTIKPQMVRTEGEGGTGSTHMTVQQQKIAFDVAKKAYNTGFNEYMKTHFTHETRPKSAKDQRDAKKKFNMLKPKLAEAVNKASIVPGSKSFKY